MKLTDKKRTVTDISKFKFKESLSKELFAGPRLYPQNMLLRDRLALDRTLMANERSLLSYTRTSLAFAGGGVTVLHFLSEGLLAKFFGISLLAISITSVVVGIYRYRLFNSKIEQ